MAALQLELHHAAPRCLLKLHDAVNGQPEVEAWLTWEEEAERWSVPVTISRSELEELVERSTEVLEREKHRLIHQTDFQRWGRRGGRETVRRYGTDWMALLALRRWSLISAEDLYAARPLR